MPNMLGITQEGIKTALEIKNNYRNHEPLCVPGETARIMTPENLLNHNLNLSGFEDPLALAMVATRDPEAPMALAAASRLGPLGRKTELVSEVVSLVGNATRHKQVSQCIRLITDCAFSPDAIARVRRHASKMIVQTRRQYTAALRYNLQALMEGSIAPRQFVHEFFELTEAGNMRNDIRKKLVSSLLLSDSVRPSIKFMMLENFERMPMVVRLEIISAVLRAEPGRHIEIIKEELRWIVAKERQAKDIH